MGDFVSRFRWRRNFLPPIFFILFLSLFWLSFLLFFIHKSLHINLPQKENQFYFFSQDKRDDLKYLVAKCINQAKQSVTLWSFGISDPDILNLLSRLYEEGLEVTLFSDPKEHNAQDLPFKIHLYQGQGIMHKKILNVDNELFVLGSLNQTSASYEFHHNELVVIRSKGLGRAIENNELFDTESFTYFPLPQESKRALECLLNKIGRARKHVYVSMYVLLHPLLLEALRDAHDRGIDVRIHLDKSMASGVGKKGCKFLKEHHIPFDVSIAPGLFHYKSALIDDDFFMSSCNWTNAGLSKNEEFLLHFILK